jgi:prephenate dehydrogenase
VGAADAALFRGATWCLTPGSSADHAAIEETVSIARGVGARPFFLDPAEHDSYVAAVSHLPFLLSVALVRLASGSPTWRDLSRVASSGFRDLTRLASGDPLMHRDICLTNRESILRWIAAYQAELSDLAEAIAGDGKDLEQMLDDAKDARDVWLEARKRQMEAS